MGGRVRAPFVLSRNLFLRGLGAVAAGLVALLWPDTSLEVVVLVLGGGTFAVGLCEAFDAFRRRRYDQEWLFESLRGLLLVAAGAGVLATPDLELDELARALGGAWALYGLLELAQGLRGRRGVREGRIRAGRGLVAAGGASVALLWPGITVVALTRTLGITLVAIGLACIPARSCCARRGSTSDRSGWTSCSSGPSRYSRRAPRRRLSMVNDQRP
ncbi:MAG: DUF308 domain-containing protein [Acidimicrobiia bacterium]|nr:DUF308 domain-containing protein [Acidimicrobiia bacterium]